MPAPTTLVHATVLRNISGGTIYFGYLGLHGTELTNGQDVAIPGNIWDLINRSQIKTDALRADLEAGRIVILQTPASYIYDAGNSKVGKVKSTSGALSLDLVLPSGSSYVGSAPNP
jgi:hypothetical protein